MKKSLFSIAEHNETRQFDNDECVVSIERYDNGDIARECYLKNNKVHREDGPASIYYSNNRVEAEYYYIDGGYHREGKPAVIVYYDDGNIEHECYYENGNIHRLDGPAKIYYNNNGTIKTKIYYLNNIEYDEFEYYVLAASLK